MTAREETKYAKSGVPRGASHSSKSRMMRIAGTVFTYDEAQRAAGGRDTINVGKKSLDLSGIRGGQLVDPSLTKRIGVEKCWMPFISR